MVEKTIYRYYHADIIIVAMVLPTLLKITREILILNQKGKQEMILRDFLDEVKFGAVGKLCIAICGEEWFLDNFEQGMYWELPAGNWDKGSESTTNPLIPEEVLFARVIDVECKQNIPQIYEKLGNLSGDNHQYTVIVVAKPYDFNADEYWTEENLNNPITAEDWPYNISKELWYEVQKAVPNTICRMLALSNLFHIGINTAIKMTDEQIDASKGSNNAVLGVPQDAILRAVRAIAQTVKDCDMNAIMALYELAGMGSAFNKKL